MELIKLALRNLSRQKKRTFLLAGAIAFGIMIVTVINGFVGAFVSNISENFANLAAGHIFIQGVEKSPSGKEYDIIRDDSTLLAMAFVALGRANHVAVVDTKSYEVKNYIPVGHRVWQLGLSPDAAKLYAVNGLTNDVSIIDVASEKVEKTVAVGRLPWGVAVKP